MCFFKWINTNWQLRLENIIKSKGQRFKDHLKKNIRERVGHGKILREVNYVICVKKYGLVEVWKVTTKSTGKHSHLSSFYAYSLICLKYVSSHIF